MKFKSLFFLCAVAFCAHLASAEQESKYNEIIKLLSDSDQQLKPAAQTYSASVADPNESYSSSRDRTRYSSSSKDKDDEDDAKKTAEDEEDKKPDRLAILLADSKFACDSLKNGYYADESVGCQVFHYCVDGVKHSWQCPENTVFHQIHLNCVPNTQDICGESSKFHVVNDYLHKELNERGPNNTVLYHQRYYPEGFDFSGGDTVTQIFQAQAQAALQKAKDKEDGRDNYRDYEDEPPARPSRPSRPKSYGYSGASTQPARAQPKPAYKPASRPASIPVTYPPTPVPTKRPISYTTPEAYTPPSYTESSQDDYSSNDYSPSSGSSSSSSSSSSSASFPSSSIGSSYNSGSVSSYSPSSPSSSYSSSSHSSHSQPSTSFRPSSSSRGNYPTRSLGIPIASFRVAPSSSGYSSAAASASTIQEVNVPLVSVPTAFNQQARGYYF